MARKTKQQLAKEQKLLREQLISEPSHLDPVPDSQFNPTEEEEHSVGGFNLRLLYHPQSKYTPAEKINAVTLYLYYGNMAKVSRATGIQESLLAKWKNHSCWWADTYEKCKLVIDEEIEAGYRRVLQDGSWALYDKVTEGEDVVVGTEQYEVPVEYDTYCPLKITRHNGVLQCIPIYKKVTRSIFEKKPILSKDLNRIVGTITDKMLLIQGKPTSISKSPEDERKKVLDDLQNKLESIAKATLQNKQLNSIPGQTEEKENVKK